MTRTTVIALLLAASALSCEKKPSETTTPSSMPTVQRYQCHRCHTIDGVDPPHPRLDCTGCHQAIFTDHFANYPDETVAQWREHVRHFRLTPSLAGVARFERDWFVEFLQRPHDVRPGLSEQMPRLPMTPEDARTIADELGVTESGPAEASAGDVDRGRDLYESYACDECHRYTGSDAPPGPSFDGPRPATKRRAPDLRHARERMSHATLTRWLAGPKRMKKDALMTQSVPRRDDREHLAAYLLSLPLEPPPNTPRPELPPPVDREVRWDEVNRTIFHATCRHCHSEGGPALPGEGGAGATGGFGYDGAGLILSSYEGVKRGSVADDGTRRDILARDEEGVAPIVRHLMARHDEVATGSAGETLGMPLGLPPVGLDRIAVLRAWIARGAPR